MELDRVLKAWFPRVPTAPLNISSELKRSTFGGKALPVCEILIFDCQLEDRTCITFLYDKIYKW